MRLDAVLIDQPAEHFGRTIGAVAQEFAAVLHVPIGPTDDNQQGVLEQLLRARREAEGNQNGRLNWIEGMADNNHIRQIPWEQFRAAFCAERV